MKIPVLFILFSALFSALQGDIQKTAQFSTLLEHVESTSSEEILIVCDIDNTLLKASQYLGSVEWSEQVYANLKARGIPDVEAAKIESLVWQSVQPHVPIELVDPKAPHILQAMQKKKITIIGLTARAPEEADYSLKQLRSLDIDLRGTEQEIQHFSLKAAAVYQEGVLFSTPMNKKSHVLLAFLEKNQMAPKRIIFIDDKLHHVEDIVNAVEKQGISCLGLWFKREGGM